MPKGVPGDLGGHEMDGDHLHAEGGFHFVARAYAAHDVERRVQVKLTWNQIAAFVADQGAKLGKLIQEYAKCAVAPRAKESQIWTAHAS